MTPTQLRTYAAVVRHGASKDAASELGVTEAAVSNHISSLRKELDDQLFQRGHSGLVFTPGGLRLASRSVEMLGLQARTKAEVTAAAQGRRVLRLAVSSLFAEYSAPGLIELFSTRAKDLHVEMAVHPPSQFEDLIKSRASDLALGPSLGSSADGIERSEFVRYQLTAVVAPNHPMAGHRLTTANAGTCQWLVGPSAVESGGVTNRLLRELAVPESNELVYQSNAAALSEARMGTGIALALAHKVAAEIKTGKLLSVALPGLRSDGVWTAYTLPQGQITPAAAELKRFITTPRAVQATLSGSAANITRFRPSVHVTLWS